MSNPGFWIVDPATQEERFIYYEELENEQAQAFIKPVGGFIFPANLFMLSKLPDVPFYVKDWLPKRGKCLLYAPAKAGKSRLCAQLARCIGCGEVFLGMPTKKGSVLYIQLELGEEILQGRLKETGKDYDNVFVGTTFSMPLDTDMGQKQLWRAMEAVEPNVLILDPWYKLMRGDENESQDVGKITNFLDSVIEGFGCSVFIIHHAGKDIAKRGRGSSKLEDWVDSYIQMQRISQPGEPLRVKIKPVYLRHAPLPFEPIEAVFNGDSEFHLVGSAQTVKQRVGEFIKTSANDVEPAQLFEQEIGANTAVYSALKELVEEGKVNKVGRGKYKWA